MNKVLSPILTVWSDSLGDFASTGSITAPPQVVQTRKSFPSLEIISRTLSSTLNSIVFHFFRMIFEEIYPVILYRYFYILLYCLGYMFWIIKAHNTAFDKSDPYYLIKPE